MTWSKEKPKGMEFMVFGNHPVENLFVEKGKDYKGVIDFCKEMHDEAIKEDQTSIIDINDWIICQYFLLQQAIAKGVNKNENR